jgi:hypothetical protein
MKQDFLEVLHEAKAFLLEEKKRKTYLFSEFNFSEEKLKSISQSILPSFEDKSPVFFSIPQSYPPIREEKKQAIQDQLPSQEKEKIKASYPLVNPLRQLIQRACPHLKLKDSIPSDKAAIQRKNVWKQRSADLEILVLEMSGGDLKQKTLLSNMAHALTSLGKKVQVVDTAIHEKEDNWDVFLSLSRLSFVIAPPLEHWKAPLLQSLIILNPTTKEAHLGKAKLLFLPPIEKLLSDLQLKLKVWKWLTTNLQA